LNSAVATPGSIPYATTQFQQVDVGTNLDLQPHVNGPDDISMKVKVEISQVSSTVSIGGIDQPVISQRVNEAEIRLRNGEVSMLGGLSNNSDGVTSNGIPGLTNLPVLGYLFGSKGRTKSDDEIVIAIIPHIVRAPDLSALGEDPIQTGTETNFRVLRSIPSSATVTLPAPGTNPAPPQNAPATAPPAAPPAQQPAPQGINTQPGLQAIPQSGPLNTQPSPQNQPPTTVPVTPQNATPQVVPPQSQQPQPRPPARPAPNSNPPNNNQ
jgi:general secretion pathway protein D